VSFKASLVNLRHKCYSFTNIKRRKKTKLALLSSTYLDQPWRSNELIENTSVYVAEQSVIIFYHLPTFPTSSAREWNHAAKIFVCTYVYIYIYILDHGAYSSFSLYICIKSPIVLKGIHTLCLC